MFPAIGVRKDPIEIYLGVFRSPQDGMKGLRACDIIEGPSNKEKLLLTK